ncbi:MFS transporter [Vibrio sp. S4M6]|uniref:MDR family MFS transporter n=1 Tax=Vibrio sinus TaxID=2946865 RepID=UPI00202ABA41|nr:MFS transporter [Vibrio sinus]MCL9781202.1 MFS transporter [Vibrio sinus]
MTHNNTQESLFKLHRVKQFNFSIWTVLIGTLLARTTYFMAWPFLIVFLYKKYDASALEIAGMLAVASLVGVLAGLYSGYLSDKIGRKWVLVCGALIAAIAFIGLGVSNKIWQFYLMMMLSGLMRPMIEQPAKALIGDQIEDPKGRELALNIRYFCINIGGAIGPLIGITLALSNPQSLFVYTGMSYIVYAIWLYVSFIINPEKPAQNKEVSQGLNFLTTLRVVKTDTLFMTLLLANGFLMFVYAQLDSNIPQILVRSSLGNSQDIVAILMMVNTITVLVFQFPLLKMLEHKSLYFRAKIGIFLMAAAQVVFVLTPTSWQTGWIIVTFLLSLGEVIIFPTLNVQIDRIAPDELRGAYFGASTICTLGFSIGPLVGGFIIESMPYYWLFALCLMFCVLIMLIYSHIERGYSELSSAVMK